MAWSQAHVRRVGMAAFPIALGRRALVRGWAGTHHRDVIDVFVALAAIFLVVIVWSVLGQHWDARDSARAALRAALERGDIREDEYAAHLRALDEAA